MSQSALVIGMAILLAASAIAAVYLAWRNVKLRPAKLCCERDSYLFDALLENTTDSIYFKDADSRFLRCSRVLLNLFGLSNPADLAGKTDRDFFTQEHALPALQDEQEVMRTGVAITKEEKETWPDGSETWVSTAKMPLRDPNGRIIGTFGISRNITEKKKVEVALQAAKDSAEAANRCKSDFLANMSHEIRTPLNGMIGMTELALGTELTGEQRELLTAARESAQVLLTLLGDILDLSKLESGKLELERVEFDLRELVVFCSQAFRVQAWQKQLEFSAELSRQCPPYIEGDPTRIRQVLFNLLGNAVKFTSKGKIGLRVSTMNLAAGPTLQFAVSDTGIGIPPEKQSVIFDAFTQAESSTTRHYGGTGLGLTISKRLAEMMGGRISLESAVGLGTTFYFSLPLVVGYKSVAANHLTNAAKSV